MRINKASIASGVSIGMIRRYERMGLMPPAPRLENGYRDYTSDDVMRLRLIHTFNELGFPLNEIKGLFSPLDGSGPATNEVRTLARAKAHELDRRAQILLAAKNALTELADGTSGSNHTALPIHAAAILSLNK